MKGGDDVASSEMTARLAAYCVATQHTMTQAIERLVALGQYVEGGDPLENGMHLWETRPHFSPERICGWVRTCEHGAASGLCMASNCVHQPHAAYHAIGVDKVRADR